MALEKTSTTSLSNSNNTTNNKKSSGDIASVDIWTLSKSDICKACLDGNYESCYCTTITNYNKTRNRENRSSSVEDTTSSCSGEFISDNEFEDFVELDLPPPPPAFSFLPPSAFLPPSRTDWRRIESVLADTIFECDEPPFDTPPTPTSEDTTLEMCSPKRAPGMQMTFVDSESDKDSIPDVEVYYEDDQHFFKKNSSSSVSSNDLFGDCLQGRDLDSRDSGFVTSDMYETSIEYVTDDASVKRRGSLEPAEISSMMLASLHLHEEDEAKKMKEKEMQHLQMNEYKKNLLKKSVEELMVLKEELELRVVEVNLELVQELSKRDELHSQHQSLLMNADDIAKSETTTTSTNNNDVTPTNSPSKKATDLSPKKEKRRSWWFR